MVLRITSVRFQLRTPFPDRARHVGQSLVPRHTKQSSALRVPLQQESVLLQTRALQRRCKYATAAAPRAGTGRARRYFSTEELLQHYSTAELNP